MVAFSFIVRKFVAKKQSGMYCKGNYSELSVTEKRVTIVRFISHNKFWNTLRHVGVGAVVAASSLTAGFLTPGVALAQTTCADLGTTFGQANYTLNAVQAGTHSLWMRIKSTDGTPSLKFAMSGGGTLCNQTMTTTGATAWKWVKSANTFTTTGSNVTLQLAGSEAGVGVDCMVLTSDTGFAPTVASDCTGPQVDTTGPTASFTAPTSGATVSGTVTVSANAADPESGVTNVLFRVNGRNDLDFTDATAPYQNSLNTSSITNGAVTLTIIATNGDGLTTTVTRNVTVNNVVSPTPTPTPTPDTTLPTVSITSPTSGSVLSGASIAVAATASDNAAVSNVKLYIDGILYLTDTTSPYAFTVNSSAMTAGAHTLYAVATDSSNNTRQSTTINFTYQANKPGDVDGNGTVNLSDFSIMRTNFGLSGKTRAEGDLSGDGTVNLTDFFELKTYFGT